MKNKQLDIGKCRAEYLCQLSVGIGYKMLVHFMFPEINSAWSKKQQLPSSSTYILQNKLYVLKEHNDNEKNTECSILFKYITNMMTSSNGNIFRITGFYVRGIHRWPVNSPHKGQWRGALMFSLICIWINGWVINREAGDLRRYRAHYDVTVMKAETPGCQRWRILTSSKFTLMLLIWCYNHNKTKHTRAVCNFMGCTHIWTLGPETGISGRDK